MIKVAIIDDEQHCIDTLLHHLKKWDNLNIVFTTTESKNAKVLLEIHNPDLVFLDIEMPFINGIDLLLSLQKITFQIIFATAYTQYAVQAFKLNALNYLLKPVSELDIENSITKFIDSNFNTTKEQLQYLKQSMNSKVQDTIALSTTNGLIFIQLKNIMYIEGEGSYTYIIMLDESKHLISKNLSNFSEILEENSIFFRPHKSFIINLHCIKQYIRGEGGEIIMKNDKPIALSRQKKQEFLSKFFKV